MGIHDREHLEVTSAAEIWAWLEANHETSPGLWVVIHKKSAGKPAPSYDEMVRVALCWGWVDSVPGKIDELQTKLYFSPRKPKSAWSQPNKIRVAELIASGQMQPAGLAKIEQAKAIGTWDLIDSAQNAEIPEDLLAALELHSGSQTNFEAFPKGVRKQILEWITLAKTDATRNKRILETASLAAENIRANQWREKNPAGISRPGGASATESA
jgi:uncharacterized protein YdeI (YjbR/CyaY-like superfamily)